MKQRFFRYKLLVVFLICLLDNNAICQYHTESINVYFDLNSSTISKEEKSRLAYFYVNSVLRDTIWFYRMQSTGYTDTTGSESKNKELAERRAHSVKGFMDSLITYYGEKQGCIDYLNACGATQWSCTNYKIGGASEGFGEEIRQNIIDQGNDSCRRVELSFIDDRHFCLGVFDICALPKNDTTIYYDDYCHLFINRGSIISPHVTKGSCIKDSLKTDIKYLTLEHPMMDTVYHYERSLEISIEPTFRIYIPCGKNPRTLIDDILTLQGVFKNISDLGYISLNLSITDFEKIIATDSIGNEIPSHLSTNGDMSVLIIPIGDLAINNGNRKQLIHLYRKPAYRKSIILTVKGRRIKSLDSQYENTLISSKLISETSVFGLFKRYTYELDYYATFQDNLILINGSNKEEVTLGLDDFIKKLIPNGKTAFTLKRKTSKLLLK